MCDARLLRRAATGLGLRLTGSGCGALAIGLDIADKLAALRALLGRVRRLVLPLAAATAAAFRLPHAVRDVVPGILRRTHIAVPAIHLATHICGGRYRTLVHLHLGYFLL